MVNHFELIATERENRGSVANQRARRVEGMMPAIVYGGNKDPLSIQLKHQDILHATKNEAFFSHILTLKMNKKNEKVVLKSMQRHPHKAQILHMDFLRVSAKEEITMNIPLHFEGENIAPGVKDGGKIAHILNDVEIKCLPQDLPEFITVDLSKLELDQSVHLSDLVLPKGVQIPGLAQGDENNLPVANLHKLKVQEVEEEKPAAEAETVAEAKPENETAEKNEPKK